MQAKLKPLKHKVIAILTVLVMLAAALSYLSFPATAGGAEAAATEVFQKEAVEISNGEFDQTSGSAPFEASNWTAAALGDTLEGATVDGVVDLAPGEINKEDVLKDYKLDKYDEFDNGKFPQTPFGKNVSENAAHLYFPGTNSKALMINSNGSRVAFGYKSSSVSLTSNSYYKISAWVKTGEFDTSGASIMVDGLKNPLIFRNIDTTSYHNGHAANDDKTKNYGWVEYNFYIETSSMMDSSVTLSLQLGDAYTYTDAGGKTHSDLHTAAGYAFFDHVTAYKLAPDEFRANTANIVSDQQFPYPDKENRTYGLSADGTTMYYSENEAEYLCIDDGKLVSGDDPAFESNEVGSFDNGGKGWSSAEESSGNFQYGVFDEVNEDLGVQIAPYSPNGTDDMIALVSTYNQSNNKRYENKNVGIVTDYFTVERFVNYRLSVWVKTENGAIASAAVTGYDYRGGKTDAGVDHGKPQLRKVTELTEGDSENKARNGWKEVAFYIKGSSFADYDVRLELRLGRMTEDGATEDAAGVAMFDNVRIERITSKEYTDYSGGGTSVTFDPEATSNSISNGDFDNIEAYDEYSEPFKPSGWTLMSAGEDSTTGMSTHKVNEDYKNYVVSGVIASDANAYKYKIPDGDQYLEGNIATHKQTEANGVPSNLLMIKSDEATGLSAEQRKLGGVAVGYRSSSFSISSESVQRVDVTLLADEIDGYGANIVLKNATNVIASVERIKTTGNKYETFSFYVQTGTSDLSEVYVEIWLGLYDSVNNTNKLAYGTLFVENVSLTNMSAAESSGDEAADDSAAQQALENARGIFASKASEYHAKRAGSPTNFAVYSSLTEDFSAFDYYEENDYVRKPYSWTIGSVSSYSGNSALKYGIFDAGEQVPAGYEHNADNRYTMLVQNVSPAATRVKSTINYALASGSYYTIKVVAKVDIPAEQKADRPNYKGAYIGITDSEHTISDVKTTATVTDIYNPDSDVDGEYKTFTFYIKTAGDLATDDETDTGSNTSDTIVTMEFGIGGTASNEEWAVGSLYVNSITVSQSSNVDFEEAQAELEKGGALQGKYSVIADYSDKEEEPDEEPDDNSNITGDNWYVYTTVLLAVVLIVVLIAVLVRYYGIKRKRDAAGNAGAPTYDREKTLVRQHNLRAEESSVVKDKKLDAYEAFDEHEEELIEEEQLRKLEAEERALLEAAEAEEDKATEAESVAELPAEQENAEAEARAETETQPTAEAAEATETAEEPATDEVEEIPYDQIVDFTPSEEKKKELEAKKAAEERAKAEKEAAEKRAAEERAKAEAEKKAANRRYNNWDSFDD